MLTAACRFAPGAHPPAVRLIGVLGGKKDLKVFERSKLLPFSIGLKDKRRPDEIEWWVAGARREGGRKELDCDLRLHTRPPRATPCWLLAHALPPPACCLLQLRPTPLPPPGCCRMNVEAWGPLAERADQQLQKGDRVAVQVGRLRGGLGGQHCAEVLQDPVLGSGCAAAPTLTLGISGAARRPGCCHLISMLTTQSPHSSCDCVAAPSSGCRVG